VSTDKGASWTERPTPFDPVTEAGIYIGAVDPNDADRVYVRSDGVSRLLVTSDAGKTFMVAFKFVDNMLGFALSADGSKVYLGDAAQGLWAASSTDLNFQNVLPKLAVQCLKTHGNDLWACSNEPSGFVAGVSNNGGASFVAKLHLLDIQSALACPGDASASMCTATNYMDTPPYNPFDGLCGNLGGCYIAPDGDVPVSPLEIACTEAGVCPAAPGGEAGAGMGDDGGSQEQPSGGGPKSSCGCSAVGGGSAAGLFAAAGLAAVAVRRRRGSTRGRGARK
jgi:MYXO-CTERM domain-containing protein